MRVLLVEPYHGGSHMAWAEGYRRHSTHDVTLVTLEARFWKWRMQGGHVTLAAHIIDEVEAAGRFDVVIASSMTNLAALLGATRRHLGGVPTVLYMHENQLTYPWSPRDRVDHTYAMINWTSMTVADAVVFNSEFHRRVWFDEVPRLLRSLPDHRHDRLVEAVVDRSSVLPVGVDLRRLDPPAGRGGRPLVLWNQRGEHDKGPDEFAAAVTAAMAQGCDFDLALAGERLVSRPAAFDRLRAAVGDRIVHDGYAPDDVYVELLRRADVVVSTAHQEFFGIAVTEAIYAGAFPLLPHRLVYPERIPPEFHDRCLHRGGDDLVGRLIAAITNRREAAQVARALRPTMAECDWSAVAPRYDALVDHVAG